MLAQAGIHAGRDRRQGRRDDAPARHDRARHARDLLTGANFLFVPIYNVDGHERFSDHGRINQRGPVEAGWRTTSQNLNLNRDYAKLDAPETPGDGARPRRVAARPLRRPPRDRRRRLPVRHHLRLEPAATRSRRPSPPGSTASSSRRATRDLEAMGHVPGPLDPARRTTTTRRKESSTGPPAPASPRATATRVTCRRSSSRTTPSSPTASASSAPTSCSRASCGRRPATPPASGVPSRPTRRRAPSRIPLEWKAVPSPAPLDFKGVAWRVTPVGDLGRPAGRMAGPARDGARSTARHGGRRGPSSRPAAWWIPPAWPGVIERLVLHGVEIERLTAPRDVEVEMYRIENAEGRVRSRTTGSSR